jgi:cytochrome o ubiquinol oxidase subunit IV
MNERRDETRTYLIGFALALLLTAGAFAVVRWQSLTSANTLRSVLALGLAQMIVHLRCFLHVSFKKSVRTDLLLIAFSTIIIVLMVSGTLVLLYNLHLRMM